MYEVVYTWCLSGGFSYNMDTRKDVKRFGSFVELLDELRYYFRDYEMDCDYKILDGIFCGERELDADTIGNLIVYGVDGWRMAQMENLHVVLRFHELRDELAEKLSGKYGSTRAKQMADSWSENYKKNSRGLENFEDLVSCF